MKVKELIKSLGEYKQRKSWYNFQCPFHHGSKMNFGVNFESRWYRCLGCGASGPLRQLPGELRRGRLDDATDILLDLSEYEENAPPGLGDTSGPSLDTEKWAYENFEPLEDYEDCKLKTRAMEYLKSRGVGVNPRIGFTDGDLTRITFLFYQKDKIVYWMSRGFMNTPRKTLNPSEEDGWLPKNRILWNYNAIYQMDTIVMTEGIFDAISVESKTELPTTCLLGSTISKEQISLLKRCEIKTVVVFMDADAYLNGIQIMHSEYRVNV